jgi:hypothetical protein
MGLNEMIELVVAAGLQLGEAAKASRKAEKKAAYQEAATGMRKLYVELTRLKKAKLEKAAKK